MRILVLGSGAREHAIISCLLREDTPHELIAAPGNAGIAEVATTIALDPSDRAAVADYATTNNIHLVVVGPEAPLMAGVADALRKRGIPVFGPSQAAAGLEGSKAFAKQVMQDAGVPTGRAASAGTLAEVQELLDEYEAPYVVKADGLAAGKGVLVTEDRDAAVAHARHWLQQGSVLVEEFLSGPEVSLFVLCDGSAVVPLQPAQDFKRAYDADLGPNTGGMGAYSPLPWLPDGFTDEIVETVALPTIRRMDEIGAPFIGLLYCGLAVTPAGPKVIEFNVRFGDPEAQVVLARLQSPLSTLMMATATGTLADAEPPRFSSDSAVTVVLASEGYPGETITGRAVTGLDAVTEATVAHAATALDGDVLVSTGGRVLSVVGTGADLAQARNAAYSALAHIRLEGSHYRTDIAAAVTK